MEEERQSMKMADVIRIKGRVPIEIQIRYLLFHHSYAQKPPGITPGRFFVRYTRQAAAVLARADICRVTDSERQGAVSETPGKRPPCLHERTFAG